MITTTRDGRRIAPAFAWSYSKLDAYETCPKQYYHKSVAKDVPDVKGEAAKYGDFLHDAAASRLNSKQWFASTVQLKDTLEPWCEKIERIGGRILVEQKLAIAEDFGPADWFGKPPRAAWMRGIADVIALSPNEKVALAVDWKSGKIKEDSVQLALMAACVFAHHPTVEAIRTEFIWLAYDASTREDFKRTDMPQVWAKVLPRVQQLRAAHESGEFPPKPGGLCAKWCPVRSCPHNGG